MTNEQLVKGVMQALLRQGGPSKGHNGPCLYRGPDGKKCAAGFLIPDVCYRSSLEFVVVNPFPENRDVEEEMLVWAIKEGGVKEEQMVLVRALQNMHDSASNIPCPWPEAIMSTYTLHVAPLVPGLSGMTADMFLPPTYEETPEECEDCELQEALA